MALMLLMLLLLLLLLQLLLPMQLDDWFIMRHNK